MKAVKINRDELLKKVRENKQAHVTDYTEAEAGYRKQVIQKLTSMLEDASSGAEIKTSVGLVAPVSRAVDYDRVIGMLEMSVDESIELEAHDFDRYVLDNWEWKQMASLLNGAYKSQ